MADHSAIEWTTHTWNPWQGCTKVSPACAHCYMYRDKRRFGQDPTVVTRSSRATFRKPLAKLQDGSWRWAPGARVFTCSWSDWFHPDADHWRPDAWDVIRQRPDLRFLILTKRPERITMHLPADWDDGWPQVGLGVTVEDQRRALERLPHLLAARAAWHFLSVEPLLGALDVSDVLATRVPGRPELLYGFRGATRYYHDRRLDWLIVGGESGPHARPTHPDWVRALRDQAQAAGVPFLFKQWGEWAPASWSDVDRGRPGQVLAWDGARKSLDQAVDPVAGDALLARVGRAAAGRELDGRTWDELPHQVQL